jgi:hypothetical protein
MTGRDFVLVAGAWQGAWLWESVTRELTARGHRAHPVTLAGLDERTDVDPASVGPQTHVDDVLALLKTADLVPTNSPASRPTTVGGRHRQQTTWHPNRISPHSSEHGSPRNSWTIPAAPSPSR